MKIKIPISSLDDYIYYMALFLFIVPNFWGITFYSVYIPSILVKAMMLSSLGLLVFKEITSARFTMKTVFAVVITFILSILSVLSNNGMSNYVYTILLLFFLKDFDFRKSAKFLNILLLSLFLFTILSSKMGIILDYIEVTPTRLRHYLGFRYSLFPSTIMLELVAINIYLKKEKITYHRLLLLLLATYWIFLQTNSRLAFISSLLLLLLGLLIKLFPSILNRARVLLFSLIPSYLYTMILSYIVIMRYPYFDGWILILNRFLGDRIYLAYKSLSIYGYDWIGQKISWVGNGLDVFGNRNTFYSYLYVDNMYVQILQRYGYIFLGILLILLTVLLLYLYNKKQYLLMTILILLAFHAAIDDLIFSLHYNIFWLLLLVPFSDKNDFSA